MRNRRIIILASVIAAVLGGVIWWAVATRPPAVPDPVYSGHPVSYWVDLDDPEFMDHFDYGTGYDLLLDSNAVPYLVEALKARDGTLRMAYERFWHRCPAWLRRRMPDPKSEQLARLNCCTMLFRLRRAARPAIPELVHVLRSDSDAQVRCDAAVALGSIGNREDKPVIEALEAAATKDKDVRYFAAAALWHLNPEAAAKAGVAKKMIDIWPDTNSAGVGR